MDIDFSKRRLLLHTYYKKVAIAIDAHIITPGTRIEEE